MTGVLLIDKPVGPTSHDVVARMRRVTGERSIGHTGTLDPLASGLLPLVMGKATRLASLFSGGDKSYHATIRLGAFTETDDAQGAVIGPVAVTLPDDAAVADALAAFRGTISQTPPAHSAKRVGGRRAYDMARQSLPVELAPVSVTVHALDMGPRAGDLVEVDVRVTAGFYVRALARDLGTRLGCGAHLAALRRTRSGHFDLSQAIPLADAERLGSGVADRMLSASEALAHLPAVTLTPAGLTRVLHGNAIGPEHLAQGVPPAMSAAAPVRLLSEGGELVALAQVRGGSLHPVTVLG